jgi:phospholipid/cholesterol/gamma-HCH transport system ATP-binding protein
MSGNKAKIVAMRGITLHFKDKIILNGVDLAVGVQETMVIMGMSGCGKSTLLSILMGLITPDAGSVEFKDVDLITLSREALNKARMHIGMVYQNAALLSSLTIGENVALPLQELTHKSPGEIDAIIDEKLDLVALQDAKNKLPSELSGGMQKRAGMARALALDPELVLFDEPTAGLDPINSEMINEMIITLRDRQKVTSIIVSHEMESAFALATRMAFMQDGKIILTGTPDEFRNSDIPIITKFLSSTSAGKIKKE